MLIVLDGWGIADDTKVSAVDQANTPFFDSLMKTYSHTKLQASGLAVGLPEGQMGNSEVGHMNLGAGRVVYQDLVKISKAIKERTIEQMDPLIDAINYAKEEDRPIHLIGLVSDGGVHSHIDHLKGLLTIFAREGLTEVYVHAFTDGRDTDPHAGLDYLRDLSMHMATTTGKIASICGRYYAMDRDKRWERVKLAYDLMVHGKGEFKNASPMDAMERSYDNDVTDEFIKPIVITEKGQPTATIQDGDVVFCFNYRTDRGREITEALTQQAFPEQDMEPLDLYYLTLTRYDDTYKNVKVLFEKDNLTETMGEAVAKAGRTQIRIAETEKYPHVTFFFSGGREDPFEGETRLMAPSPKVATYDLQPEMSARELRDKIVPKLKEGKTDFVCLNFANPDMVGHTGVFSAAVKACEVVDECLQAVIEAALESDYAAIVLADHGNADRMKNPDGSPHTQHTTVPVPCILVDKKLRPQMHTGVLGDVAPTLLKLMGIPQPELMTGKPLY